MHNTKAKLTRARNLIALYQIPPDTPDHLLLRYPGMGPDLVKIIRENGLLRPPQSSDIIDHHN